ncbi:MAG: MerR family transcriptional regulator [Saprospiraceae bacterium]|nr:MerR family transcriptional regulator [Saprospiraceae bacterium]
MAIYSIADLEILTGIKAHTIRIWEKRFNFVQPKRTATNIRFYDDQDLKKISRIALLHNKGYRISNICNLKNNELEDLVAQNAEVSLINADSLDALTLNILQLDEVKFIHLLNKQIEIRGFDFAFTEFILPLLDKLNEMWLSGSIRKAHEEFALQIIKRKIIQQINIQEHIIKDNPNRFLLLMPQNENQQLNRLYIEYMLSKNKMSGLYISSDADMRDVVEAIDIFKANHIITFVNEQASLHYADELISRVELLGDKVELSFLGYLASTIFEKHPHINEIKNYSCLIQFLKRLNNSI